MPTYAWIITHDLIATPESERGTYQNAVGIIGPHDATVEQVARLEVYLAGDEFRIYDDDGEHYYTGRIVFDDDDPTGEDQFAPLTDFGGPNAGASDIRYWIDGEGWVSI